MWPWSSAASEAHASDPGNHSDSPTRVFAPLLPFPDAPEHEYENEGGSDSYEPESAKSSGGRPTHAAGQRIRQVTTHAGHDPGEGCGENSQAEGGYRYPRVGESSQIRRPFSSSSAASRTSFGASSGGMGYTVARSDGG